MTDLRSLQDDATEFTIEYVDDLGDQYQETFYIEDRLSIARYSMFERFRLEVGFGMSFTELVKVLQSTIDFCERIFQGEKVMTSLVNTNYNALRGINDLATKKPFAVWLCTLFMNTKDEDRRWFDETVMRRKIQIWEWAGIDSAFFLKQALALVTSFSEISYEITKMSFEHDQILNSETGADPLSELSNPEF